MSTIVIPESVGNTLKGKSTLVLWGPGCAPENVQKCSQELSAYQCSIVVEHSERLILCKLHIHSFEKCMIYCTNFC